MLCYVMLCYVMSCYVMLCYVMLYYIILLLFFLLFCCKHKTFSFISRERLSFYTALTVTSILLEPATTAITSPSTGGYREKHKKQ